MRSKSRTLLVFGIISVFVIIVCAFIIFPDSKSRVVDENSPALHAFRAREELRKKPLCKESIVVSIEKLTFILPRLYLTVTDSTGKQIDYLQYRCEIGRIDNVRAINYPELGLSTVEARGPDFKTRYQTDQSTIEKRRSAGNSVVLSDGTEIFSDGYSKIYVISQNAALTHNSEPISINCASRTWCSTSYILERNLAFSYGYYTQQNHPINVVERDAAKRDWINKHIVDTGN